MSHIEYLRCNFRHSPTRFCRLHYSANSRPTYTAAEVSFPRNRLRAATQPLRRNSSLRCSLTEVLDLPPRRRATAGVSGEQILDVADQNMFSLQAPRVPSVSVDQSTCNPKSEMTSWSLTSYVSNIIALPKPFLLPDLVIIRLSSVSQYSDVGNPDRYLVYDLPTTGDARHVLHHEQNALARQFLLQAKASTLPWSTRV